MFKSFANSCKPPSLIVTRREEMGSSMKHPRCNSSASVLTIIELSRFSLWICLDLTFRVTILKSTLLWILISWMINSNKFPLPLNSQLHIPRFAASKLCHRKKPAARKKIIRPTSKNPRSNKTQQFRHLVYPRRPRRRPPTASPCGGFLSRLYNPLLSLLGNSAVVRCPHHSFTSFSCS